MVVGPEDGCSRHMVSTATVSASTKALLTLPQFIDVNKVDLPSTAVKALREVMRRDQHRQLCYRLVSSSL